MKAVGVKQLKAHLSEYLRLVRTGATVLVTERDEVVAELRPAPRRIRASTGVRATLEALEEAGEITRAALPKRGWTWKARGAGLPAGTAAKLLAEVRADRDGGAA
jgi:antitoxin (DNA-binding transcriptional repressor) of toxin-antitoxin stability system